MKILVLGGTSDTRKYLETCVDDFIVTVATQYGYDTFNAYYPGQVVLTRFTEDSMKDFIKQHAIEKIVDTTHPFAKVITETAIKVSLMTAVPYEDRMRRLTPLRDYDRLFTFETYEEAADFLKSEEFSSVLLTTGSNNVEAFKDVMKKCFVRILPYEKSIEKCREMGFEYKQIIAMQGPFTKEFNVALIRQIKADALVTKMSGEAGGTDDKIDACEETGAACVVITGGGK